MIECVSLTTVYFVMSLLIVSMHGMSKFIFVLLSVAVSITCISMLIDGDRKLILLLFFSLLLPEQCYTIQISINHA